MHLKFTESKTAFRNINGADVSDEEWKKSIVYKCCIEVAGHFKKAKTKAFRDPELKHEIKNHPFVKLINENKK